MNMEIYEDGIRLDLENISITRYENKVFQLGERLNELDPISFSSIHQLTGNKEILESCFIAELNEQL